MGLEELLPDANALLTDEEAILEAERCLNCGGPGALPPCMAGCPARIDVPKFINEIRDQRPLDAAATIFASNPLGATCARVCPAADLCECACALAQVGREPVRIAQLQRYATEMWLDQQKTTGSGRSAINQAEGADRQAQSSGSRSIAVIGAGPAGLSCAAELARLGHRVTIYEKRPFAGGLVTTAIAPYKQWYEPIPQEVDAIAALGVEFRFGEHMDADRFRRIDAMNDATFLGIGLGCDKLAAPHGLPNEDLKNVWPSLAFIDRVKRGVIDDLSDQRVIVIGGGNAAVEVARTAMMLGAEEVLVLYGRSEEYLSANRHEILAALNEGVRFLFRVVPVRMFGKWKVKAVECVRVDENKTPHASTTPEMATPVAGSEFVIEADLVINATGQRPLDDVLDKFDIEHRDGYVTVDENFRTSNPRCFAGGDCVNGGATVVEAVQHGQRAASAIHRQLTGCEKETPQYHSTAAPAARRWRHHEIKDVPVGAERINGTIRHYQGDHAILIRQDACKGCPDCIRNCPIGSLELDEAKRIRMTDIGSCIFCGLCEEHCPEGAIRMDRPEEALR
jgi:dihydropyrimidine dehydrogenase (NAD+) subunit PreT